MAYPKTTEQTIAPWGHFSLTILIYGPRREPSSIWGLLTTKAQTSMYLCPGLSAPWLFAFWNISYLNLFGMKYLVISKVYTDEDGLKWLNLGLSTSTWIISRRTNHCEIFHVKDAKGSISALPSLWLSSIFQFLMHTVLLPMWSVQIIWDCDVSFFLFCTCACLCRIVLSVSFSLMVTYWERAYLFALLYVMFSYVLSRPGTILSWRFIMK